MVVVVRSQGPEEAGGWPGPSSAKYEWDEWCGEGEASSIQPTARNTEIMLNILWDSDHSVQFIEWSHRSRWLGTGQQNIQVLFLFVCKVFLVFLVTVSPLPPAWLRTHFPGLSPPPAPPPTSPTPASWWFWKPTWTKLLGLGFMIKISSIQPGPRPHTLNLFYLPNEILE